MIRDAYSAWKARAPNVALRCLSAVSSGLARAKTGVDDLSVRLRRTRNGDLLEEMYAPVVHTSPLPCNPASQTAIHTVTSHHHLRMYLTAIKSLLRYSADVAVVVHDDGSLDADDELLLDEHIPGVKRIDRRSADEQMADAMARYPRCRALRERVVNSLELFDNMLLAPAARTINMNSDVLFLGEPVELKAWIAGKDSSILGVFEAEPAEQAAFLARRGSGFPPHVTTALTCFHPNTCDLDFVEATLAEAPPDWFTAQNVYPLLYERQLPRRAARFLDERSYQASGVFGDGAVFRHYWSSTGKFAEVQRRDAERVLGALAGHDV